MRILKSLLIGIAASITMLAAPVAFAASDCVGSSAFKTVADQNGPLTGAEVILSKNIVAPTAAEQRSENPSGMLIAVIQDPRGPHDMIVVDVSTDGAIAPFMAVPTDMALGQVDSTVKLAGASIPLPDIGDAGTAGGPKEAIAALAPGGGTEGQTALDIAPPLS